MGRAARKNEDRVLWTGEKSMSGRKGIKLNVLILITLLTLFFTGGALLYVWSRIQVIRLGYEISDALKEERRLTEANKKLRLEIATLKSCPRIERFAAEELRMAKPKPEQVIVIR
jgi:cell division protein FtsL